MALGGAYATKFETTLPSDNKIMARHGRRPTAPDLRPLHPRHKIKLKGSPAPATNLWRVPSQ